MTNLLKDSEKRDTNLEFDPVIACSWLPDREVKLSEYNEMITYFVQKHISERLDAKPIYSKEFTFRQESDSKSM